MTRVVPQFVAAAALICVPVLGFASSTDASATEIGQAEDGRPYEYNSPVCREARARAESAAQVPGFETRLEEIISLAPECFVGWEPGDG
ncbi:MAG: hypothetical protein AAGK37_05830 [Pseudomonadota bacterium]